MLRVILLALLVFAVGCKKPPPPPEPVVVAPPPPPPAPAPTQEEAVEQILRNFQRVHFEFDSTALAGDSMAALRENAEILQHFPDLRVEIQGHADERGTTDYNLALGQRRASTIKDYLAQMGVASTRVSLVSYGEERPLERGASEWAWAQNRRAEFRVLTPVEGVQGTVP